MANQMTCERLPDSLTSQPISAPPAYSFLNDRNATKASQESSKATTAAWLQTARRHRYSHERNVI
jgi:hypothetical protein